MLDPASFSGLGGLETIDDRVAHVHLKDVSASGEWTEVGDGIVDFAALLRHLAGMRYDGYLSFETHYQRDGSGELATRDCVAALRSIAARGPRGARRVRLRYGVIGAGVVAPLHLQAIAALDDVELVGISAHDQELAVARAQEAGCPSFVDHRELLALAPDVVVVCTPHPSHPPLAIEALEAGAHVLVEKPLAVEAREADTMIDAADRAGRLLGVCFQQRFRPVIAAARELIASGRLGELVRVSIVDPLYRPNAYYGTAGWRGTWKGEGGGVLMNQAPHTLDLLCHLAGPPATVWGAVAAPLAADGGRGHGDRRCVEYDNGAVGTIAVSTVEPGVQRIELVGDRGRIEIVGESLAFERFEPPLSEHLPAATEMFEQPAIVSENVALPAGRGDHLDVHRDFAAAIRTGSAPRVPARDARWSLELANAIVLSTHTGQAVPLPVDRDGIRGSARRPALRAGDDALRRIAVSNLAAPEWTLERMLAAVREYGYDGLELRLLDGEPIDALSLDAGTRRAVGTTLARAAVPLVCLDTSIELARPFDRELPAAVELACEWGAPAVRVFGGASARARRHRATARARARPSRGAGGDDRTRDPRQLRERGARRRAAAARREPVVRSDLGRPSSVPGRRGAGRRPARARRAHPPRAREGRPPPWTRSGSSSLSARGRSRCVRASPLSARPATTAG